MPLNYSKWDKLELSDDSDIEGHPNVDKKSLIRWKQRDIHEKREVRKLRMAELTGEIETTNILLPRIRSLISAVDHNGPREFSTLMERLKTSPSDVGPVPPPGAPKAPSYDEMILQLLYKVWEDVRGKPNFDIKDETKTGELLVKELKTHDENLVNRLSECKTELAALEKEAHEKITSDDIHEGWDSHYVPHHEEELELAPTKPTPRPKAKEKVKETVIETLNAPKTLDAHVSDPVSVPPEDSGYVEDDEDDDADDEDEDIVPDLTPSLAAFSKIPPRDFEASLHFLQNDKSPLKAGSMDALLVAAFSAELRGDRKYAKSAVHQALLLEYCEKLGKDGITVFFKRMMSGNPAPQKAFLEDVDRLYSSIEERAAKARVAQTEGKESIQLAVQDPDTTSITFNLPDGPPPPEDKELKVEWEGEDGGDIDVDQVRQWLKRRWDIWQSFPKQLRRALKTKELDRVNEVLGDMSVEEAEKVVGELQEAGILSFVEGGVRDETPAGLAARAAAEEAARGSGTAAEEK